MTDRIYLSSPDVTDVEEQYLVSAFRSGWVAPVGPEIDKFESEIAERVGAGHGVALSSGTAALHLALLVQGVGPGDVVITSSLTFAATANAISYTGAVPYFVDCLPTTGNMDPQLLAEAIKELRRQGANIAAVVPVDLLGKAVDYSSICELAARHEIPIIADAAESLGASHQGRPVGAWGQASAFSFNGNKIMTTSGGGMLMTNDADLAARVRYLATQARQPVVHYEHVDVGYNYRLSNLLAALGRAQLSRLDSMIARRRSIRTTYRSYFDDVPGVRILGGNEDSFDNCWLTCIIVDPDVTGWEPDSLRAALHNVDIESRPLWKPMHLQPIFANHKSKINGSSQKLFETGLTLPSGSALSSLELYRVLRAISEFVGKSLE